MRTTSEAIAERSFAFRDQPGRVASVRIYRPESAGDGWVCRVAFVGFGHRTDPYVRENQADDSAGALLKAVEDVARTVEKIEALRIAGVAEERPSGEFRNPWHIKPGAFWLPMPVPLPGEVILERMLDIAADKRTARVTIFKPTPQGAGHWMCRFLISDLRAAGDLISSHAGGVDSSQALFLAIRKVGSEIELIDGVTWCGQQPWEALAERGDAAAG